MIQKPLLFRSFHPVRKINTALNPSSSFSIRVIKLSRHNRRHLIENRSNLELSSSHKLNENIEYYNDNLVMSKRKTNSVQEYHTNTPSLNKKQTIRGSLSNKSHSNNSSNRISPIVLQCDDSVNEDDRKKRQCLGIPYPCICLCALLYATLLIGIIIASILIALLIKPITTTTTATTVTTTTTTETTTTTAVLLPVTFTNETVYGIWNTVAGGNSTLSLPGTSIGSYYPSEMPSNILDKNINTKYTNFGPCNYNIFQTAVNCGVQSGLYLTLQRGAILLLGVRFCTALSLPNRDPITITIEGSNQTSTALMLGSSWTLIYNGSTGLSSNPGRGIYGPTQSFSNSIVYSSYRILVTSIRNVTDAVQYAEVELIGY